MTEDTPATERDELAEQGRKLASEREDLIASGVDPDDLLVPLHPDDADSLDSDEVPELAALDDGDFDPDAMVGDPTSSDVDLSFLEVELDKDGGDSDE